MTEKTQKLPDISASHANAIEAVNFAVRFLAELLEKQRFTVPKGETPLYLQMRRDLPYFIHKTKSPATQILVNRNYKPLGNSARTAEEWVDYELCTNVHIRLSQSQIEEICAPNRDQSLFGDGDPPWDGRSSANAYMKKLLRLRQSIAAT